MGPVKYISSYTRISTYFSSVNTLMHLMIRCLDRKRKKFMGYQQQVALPQCNGHDYCNVPNIKYRLEYQWNAMTREEIEKNAFFAFYNSRPQNLSFFFGFTTKLSNLKFMSLIRLKFYCQHCTIMTPKALFAPIYCFTTNISDIRTLY